MQTPPPSPRTRVSTLVVALAVPLIAALALALTRAIEGPGSATAAASTASPGGKVVVIRNFSFAPKTLTVAAGSRVTVTNDDRTEHTLTAQDGSFDTGVLAGGKHSVLTFAAPGTFRYHCNIHQNMTGTVVVR